MSEDLLKLYQEIQEKEKDGELSLKPLLQEKQMVVYTVKSAAGWIVASVFGGLFIGTLLITWLF